MHNSKFAMWMLFNWQWVALAVVVIAVVGVIVWWKS